MPTAFYAQNGAQIHQNTPTTGCPKTKKAKKTKKKAGKGRSAAHTTAGRRQG
jgi:hypothetical protein